MSIPHPSDGYEASSPGSTDHLYDRDAERALLASCLANPETFIDIVGTVEEGSFTHPGHRALYAAMLRLDTAGRPFDLVTVIDELRRAGDDGKVNGREGLQRLLGLAEPAHVDAHARIVADKAMLRNLSDAGRHIWTDALAHDAVGADALEAAEKRLYQVATARQTSSAVPMAKAVSDTIAAMEAARAAGGRIVGLSTGLTELDEMTGGMTPGQLLILAARPAMGKCVAAGAVVADPVTGIRRTIGDLAAAGPDGIHVQSYDFATVNGVTSPVAGVFDNGVKDVVTVTTRTGRTFTVTPNHRVRTLTGWVQVADLQVGVDGIAIPTRLPHPTIPVPMDRPTLDQLVAAADRHVDDRVFRLPADQLTTFLQGLWTAVGWMAEPGVDAATVGFNVATRQVGDAVAHLLLRFGILAHLTVDAADGRCVVTVHGPDQVATFLQAFVPAGMQADPSRLTRRLAAIPGAGDVDRFPVTMWDLVDAARPDTMSWEQLFADADLEAGPCPDRSVGPSRALIAAAATATGDTRLAALADGAVAWDVVESVVAAGQVQTYDIEVLPHHNFVCDDVVVHNSSLAVNVAQAAAERSGDAVYIASYEMSREEITTRMIASTSGIDLSDLKRGMFPAGADRELARATEHISQLPIFIDDEPPDTPMMLRSEMRRLARRGKLGLVVVDYLQLMSGGGRASDNRAQVVEEMTRQLKLLAKELKCPVLCLSQLSRKCEERHDKRPMLSDLRDSGGIEQNADNVYFLYRPWVYDNRADPEAGELIIGKHRSGPTGTIRVRFHGPTTTYSDVPRGPAPDFADVDGGPPPIGPLGLTP